jgi:hypothetical protein
MEHKGSHNDLTQERVMELFDYNPFSGGLTRRVSMPPRGRIGELAGFFNDQGSIKIGINGKEYFAHRIIWLWMTGKWPNKEIDHINENPSDNRWENLREATPSENHRNRGKQRNNTTGFKGVTFNKRLRRYIAGVKLNQKRYNVKGSFKTPEEAYEAVCKLALMLHGEWSRYK